MAARPLPDPDLVRQLVRYNPKTGKLYWRRRKPKHFQDSRNRKAAHICALWNVRYAGKEAFRQKADLGYLVGFLLSRHVKSHRVIFAIMENAWPPNEVDHINGVRDDNRWVNLRHATNTEQNRNTGLRADNKTGVTGVQKERKCASWRVTLGKGKTIGFYRTFEEAVKARRAAEIEHGYHPNHGRKRA